MSGFIRRGDLMAEAFGINLVLMGLGTFAFIALLRSAREAGTLLQTGE